MFNSIFYILKAIVLFPLMMLVIVLTTVFGKRKTAVVLTKTKGYTVRITSEWIAWVLYPLFYVDPMLLKPIYVIGEEKNIYVCQIFKDYFGVDAYVLFMWWYIRMTIEKDNIADIVKEFHADIKPYIEPEALVLAGEQIRKWLTTFGKDAMELTKAPAARNNTYFLDSVLKTMLVLEKELS